MGEMQQNEVELCGLAKDLTKIEVERVCGNNSKMHAMRLYKHMYTVQQTILKSK